jgi:predicted NBD/HSP70 family sugar kinase
MQATRTGSKRLLRDLNRSIVLNLIAARAPISRADLAREGNLPAPTVTRIVGDFVEAGLVIETQSEESSGGRRPVHLTINPDAGHVVGVKLREDGATVALCDLACTVVHHREVALGLGAEPHEVVTVIAAAIERCIEEARVARARVLGVGVGISGLIDSARGICRYSAILGWTDVGLGSALEFKLRMPVRVDNDVNTLAVAERHFGAGRDVPDFLLVTIGRGIGLGVVVGGEIYRGAHGGAGEFGHMTVDTSPDAPPCNCGKRGCLEAIASDYGILRAATGEDPGHHVEDEMGLLVNQAHDGDPRIRAIFARAGTALGVAVANLINIFDPAFVLIGGEGLRAGDLLLDPLHETLPNHVFGSAGKDPSDGAARLFTLTTTDVEWARGAASLVLREVFRPPIYETGTPLPIDDLLARKRQRTTSALPRRALTRG